MQSLSRGLARGATTPCSRVCASWHTPIAGWEAEALLSEESLQNQLVGLLHRGLTQPDRAPLEALRGPLEEHEEALLVEILRQRLADPELRALLRDPRRERDLVEGERIYLRSLVACGPDATFLAERRTIARARRRAASAAAPLLRSAAVHLAVQHHINGRLVKLFISAGVNHQEQVAVFPGHILGALNDPHRKGSGDDFVGDKPDGKGAL